MNIKPKIPNRGRLDFLVEIWTKFYIVITAISYNMETKKKVTRATTRYSNGALCAEKKKNLL